MSDEQNQIQPVVPSSACSTRGERYTEGWRSGRPLEDPDKIKRWGFIVAKPSEYLVCIRGGRVDRRRSGQGARVFKWPWEAVAIVPTTLQRVEFRADQITRERVGVSVTGFAVYRIADPELASRVLNFTYGEAASEKLNHTLRDMFIGAARRLMANLTLDECLTRRKEAIATFLMREVAPVVGGRGSPEDTTDQGWGVVIDTIEIQDVRIQSQQVFAHLQAPFRAEIAARAELAELERQRRVSECAAEAQQRSAEMEQARRLQEIKDHEAQRRAQAQAEVAALSYEAQRAEEQHRLALRLKEQERVLQLFQIATEAEVRERRAQVELELRRRELEVRRLEGEAEAAQQQRMAEIELQLGQIRALRDLVNHGLPQVAAAFSHSYGTVHYTHIGTGGDGLMGQVAAGIAHLLSLLRGLGLDPAQLASSTSSAAEGAAPPPAR
ncbi:MAG: SPFH domain-containing protein [Myxococcales bacterium]|nr:SPFH domain-containing protein [Myxococcota bacterium]MDW8282595.1 SPFH domain-containing protein [Myxococcales bacterium]